MRLQTTNPTVQFRTQWLRQLFTWYDACSASGLNLVDDRRARISCLSERIGNFQPFIFQGLFIGSTRVELNLQFAQKDEISRVGGTHLRAFGIHLARRGIDAALQA